MGNFNGDRGQSGGRNFGRRDFGDRGTDRPMHQAICSKCNKECEVPFRPTGSRPVFCKDCFQNNRASGPIRFDSNYSRRSDFEDRGSSQINRPAQPQYKEQFEALNAKLDKILKILEPKITVVVPAETPKTPKVKKATKVAKKSTSTKEK